MIKERKENKHALANTKKSESHSNITSEVHQLQAENHVCYELKHFSPTQLVQLHTFDNTYKYCQDIRICTKRKYNRDINNKNKIFHKILIAYANKHI